jgi:hypothetical protein
MPFDSAEFYASPVRARQPRYHRLRALLRLPSQDAPLLRVAAPAEPEIGVVQLLETAKRMIENPGHWVKGSYATSRGRHCAVGALRAAASGLSASSTLPHAHAFLLEVAGRRGFETVERMNDRSMHGEVMAAFDEAIAAARHGARIAA